MGKGVSNILVRRMRKDFFKAFLSFLERFVLLVYFATLLQLFVRKHTSCV